MFRYTAVTWHVGSGLMPWDMLCQCYRASLKLATVQTPQGLHFTREYNQSHVPSVHSSWLPPWASIHSACGELYSTWRIYTFCLPCWALLGRSLSILCLSFSSCEQGWALQLWVAQFAEIISEFSSEALFHSSLPSTENWSNFGLNTNSCSMCMNTPHFLLQSCRNSLDSYFYFSF